MNDVPGRSLAMFPAIRMIPGTLQTVPSSDSSPTMIGPAAASDGTCPLANAYAGLTGSNRWGGLGGYRSAATCWVSAGRFGKRYRQSSDYDHCYQQ
jgi:hypothetical protein